MAERSAKRLQGGSVVITGASAGVGRAVALAFAREGAPVALLARGEDGLAAARQACIAAGAPRALAIAVDVADADAVFAAADRAEAELGPIRTWVNCAMATVFSPVREMTPAEFRRVTEVTYLGYVHGTLAALRHMRAHGLGTIVQVGSALSYRAIPLQSAYCGAKFAIRGFTDSLRSELLHERSPIRVTMVQLPAVNTPQFDWARSHMPRRAQPVPPIHQPEAVAAQILRAARHAPRELWVGWPSVRAILGTMVAPGLLDRLLGRTGYQAQMTTEPEPADRPDNLMTPLPGDHGTHGPFDARARARVGAIDPALLRGAAALLAVALPAVSFAAASRAWRPRGRGTRGWIRS